MKLESLNLPFGPSLSDAFCHRKDPDLLELFGYHPTIEEHWHNRASWLQQHEDTRAERSRLAEVLSKYNDGMGAGERTIHAINKLREGALTVVGGQQAGLWLGPLLIIHKAVSIIQTARSAAVMLKRPVVPVFWIAGEDHDWEEAAHTYLVTSEPSLRKLTIKRKASSRTSVSRTKLTWLQWEAALSELADSLADSPWKMELIGKLEQFARSSRSLTEMNAMCLLWLFRDEGLIVVDADDPLLRKLEAPMFERMIRENDPMRAAYEQSAHTIAQLGYSQQVELQPNGANLFLFAKVPRAVGTEEEDRILLYKEGDTFYDRKDRVLIQEAQLLEIARNHPERLSNNVLTRPLMQDYLFPVLATVLGSSEVAYWPLASRAFRAMGMQMPIIVPRRSFTLLDPLTQKQLQRYGLTVDIVRERFEEFVQQWLLREDGQALDQRFDEIRAQLLSLYEPLLQDVLRQRAELSSLVETNRRKLVEPVDFLLSRVQEDRRRRHDVSLRQLQRLQLMIWPEDKPQERVLNFTALWNAYGGDWLKRLLETPDDLNGNHCIMHL